MARRELAQGIIQLSGFMEGDFSIFGDHTGITRQRGAKCSQAVAAGVNHTQRFAQEQNGFETLFNQVLGGSGGRLGVIQSDHIAGKFRDFAVNKHHRERRLLQTI